MFSRVLGASLFLYTVSLITTMAGMEIFSWLTFVIVLFGLCYKAFNGSELSALRIHRLGPDPVVWLLLGVVILGVVINGAPGIDATESIGSMRWIFTMYALLAALLYFEDIPQKFLTAFLLISGLVALNSIIMSLTGFNLVRNESVIYSTEGVYRGSGFFSIPTTYAHSAAMICCLSISALLIKYRPFRRAEWFFAAITVLLGLSIVTSYTRASYISLTAAVLVMTVLVSRKLFLKAMVGMLVAGAILFATSDGFQRRVVSIFDMQYESNSQRIDLWRAHFAMFKDYPVLGVGLHDNERRNHEYNLKLGQEGAFAGNAHNNYLQFLAGTGALGLLLYLVFISYYLVLTFKMWQKREKFSALSQCLILGILGAQVSFHVAGLMDNNFKDAEVNHLFLFMLVVATAIDRKVK